LALLSQCGSSCGLETCGARTDIDPGAAEQLVGPERREREVIADFQLPIVDLIRAARSTVTFGGFTLLTK
jgi:hypothetical protein